MGMFDAFQGGFDRIKGGIGGLLGFAKLKGDSRFADLIEEDLDLDWDELNKGSLLGIPEEEREGLMSQMGEYREDGFDEDEFGLLSGKINQMVGDYNIIDEDARGRFSEGLSGMGPEGFGMNYDYFKKLLG